MEKKDQKQNEDWEDVESMPPLTSRPPNTDAEPGYQTKREIKDFQRLSSLYEASIRNDTVKKLRGGLTKRTHSD